MEPVLAAAAAGLLLLPFLPALPSLPVLLLPVPFLLFAAWRWRRGWLCCPAVFLLAFAWSVQAASAALAVRLPPALEGVSLLAEGRVEGLSEPSPPRGLRFRFRPTRIFLEDGRDVRTDDLWQLFSALPDAPLPGADCRVRVRLKRPHGTANPGTFDHEEWLLSEGVTATGSVQGLSCDVPSGVTVDRLRLGLRDYFRERFPERPAAGVVLALVSGDRSQVSALAWERYAATGVVHLMAISGMHITLLAALAGGLVLQLLRRFPALALYLPLHKPALLAGLAVAAAYSLVAGYSVPTERTLVMLAVVVAAHAGTRRLPSFLTLLLALVAVLLWSPLAVHAAGFWLSFGAVAILMLAGRAYACLPAWQQGLRLQLALSLLLMPMTLWFFGRVSWVSPLANLIAVPLVTFAVVPLGLLGLLAWLLLPAGLCDVPWQAAITLTGVLDALLEQFQSWPGASLDWGLPGWTGLLWLSLALLCMVQPLQPRLRLMAPCFLLPLFGASAPPSGVLRLTLIDVGQGLAVLVETTHYRMLYDTGPSLGPDADAGSRIVLPVLRRAGVRSLDQLLLSHDDNDHTGGAASILARMPVREILGALPRRLVLPVDADRTPCRAGQRHDHDGWRFEVLYPDAEEAARARKDNDRSCVLRISRGRSAVLLPGDLETTGEAALLARAAPASLRAAVLVLGHHGSKTATSAEFLAAVAPRRALVSAGYRNPFHHPSAVTLARLQAAGVPWQGTAEGGALRLEIDGDGVHRLAEFRREAGRYWYAEPPARQ